MGKELDIGELVQRARSGEVAAFEDLFRSHQAAIYTFILSQVRDRDNAADLTQETFVRAWESLRRLRQPEAFRSWLHRIAANLVRDHVKSGRARLEITQSALAGEGDAPSPEFARPDGGDPSDGSLSAQEKSAVWQALNELSAEQRGAVVMHHLEGMSVEEIARVQRVRPGTVMSRLARAREALRKRLAPLVEAQDG